MTSEMDAAQKEMRQLIMDICWHMRGSISYNEAWMLSPRERRDIRKLIEERMKIVEKTHLPLI